MLKTRQISHVLGSFQEPKTGPYDVVLVSQSTELMSVYPLYYFHLFFSFPFSRIICTKEATQ